MSKAQEEAIALVANALHIEPAAVDDLTALGISPEWNSLAHLHLILALEERLGRQLEPEAIVGITDIDAALGYLVERPEVDPARIALWGTSFGGANAIRGQSN